MPGDNRPPIDVDFVKRPAIDVSFLTPTKKTESNIQMPDKILKSVFGFDGTTTPVIKLKEVNNIAPVEPSKVKERESDFWTDVKETLGSITDLKDVSIAIQRGLAKHGIGTPGTEETPEIKIDLPKKIEYKIPTIKEKVDTFQSYYKQGTGIDDPASGTHYGKYVNMYSGFNGQEYIPTKNVGEWKKDNTTKYSSEQQAHYLLDIDPTTGYQHPISKGMIDKQLKNHSIVDGSTVKTQYVPVYEKMENGNLKVNYKTVDEIGKSDKVLAPLRQYRFDDIDWNSDIKSSWNKSSSAFKTKTGYETNIIKSGKNMSGYGQFGGGSFVLIGKKENGEKIIADVAGSAQDLYNQAHTLAAITKQKVSDIIVAYHDVGSWSAKPQSKDGNIGFEDLPKKDAKNFKSYQYDWTGGGLAFPLSTTKK